MFKYILKMKPVISKGGWHRDYYESLVKALTFLFLFCDSRFGLGSNCSHPIPRATGSLSWSTKPQEHHFPGKQWVTLFGSRIASSPETGYSSLEQDMVNKDNHRLCKPICISLNTYECFTHATKQTSYLRILRLIILFKQHGSPHPSHWQSTLDLASNLWVTSSSGSTPPSAGSYRSSQTCPVLPGYERPCNSELKDIPQSNPHKPMMQQVGDMKPYSLRHQGKQV